MLTPILILFGASFTILVAVALGGMVLARTGVRLYRPEAIALRFVIGAACLSLLVFLTLALHAAYAWVFLLLGAAILALAALLGVHRNWGDRFPPLPLWQKALFGVPFAVFTVLYFFSAMAPEMSPDGAAYHLALVSRYLRQHGFAHIVTNIYASLSQGVEMLFTFAFAFGRHSAAALIHYAFLLALALLMLSYGRRIGRPLAGIAGALLTYLSPIVGIVASSAYVDAAVAATAFSLFYLLELRSEQKEARLLASIGILAGFGYAVKYTAVVALPYALGVLAWRERKWKPLLMVAACALVLIVPWMAKDWVIVQNPVSPFFNQLFPNPYVHVSFEHEYRQYLRTYNLANLWTIPLELTIRGQALTGLLGPIFLLAPVALLALRSSEGRRLLAAALVFLVPYPANIGARFLIPALPFVSLAMAMAFEAWRPLVAVLILADAVSSWPSVQKRWSPYAWTLGRIPFRQALRLESQDHWFGRRYPDYAIAQLIEQKVPPGAHVLAMNGVPEAYTRRDVVVSYQSAYGELMGDMFQTGFVRGDQPVRTLEFRFAPRVLRRLRAVQTAQVSGDEQWSITEFRVYSGSAELPRAPEWRLRARPNAWDVQLAFDNSPVTRWRTWQTAAPGMFVEVDLGAPRTVDRVELEGSAGQWHTRVRLDGMDETGHWITLSAKPDPLAPDPPPGMRQTAIREMKSRGIDYLLLRDGDWGASDVAGDPEAWDLVVEGRANHATLYRIASESGK